MAANPFLSMDALYLRLGIPGAQTLDPRANYHKLRCSISIFPSRHTTSQEWRNGPPLTLPGIVEEVIWAAYLIEAGARGSEQLYGDLSVSVLAGTETCGWLGSAQDEKGSEGDVVQCATTPGNRTSLNKV